MAVVEHRKHEVETVSPKVFTARQNRPLHPATFSLFFLLHPPLNHLIFVMAAAQGFPLLCLENPLLGKSFFLEIN